MAPAIRQSSISPNSGMTMSGNARSSMRSDERVMLKYYNDMGKNKGNCSWGIGFYVHKGICSSEELGRKVDVVMVDVEYGKRVGEAERRVKAKVHVKLTQEQFDALVSFTYNTSNIANQPVYDALNGGKLGRAAEIISSSVYVKIDGKMKLAPGLVRRRAEESAPFRAGKTSSKN